VKSEQRGKVGFTKKEKLGKLNLKKTAKKKSRAVAFQGGGREISEQRWH